MVFLWVLPVDWMPFLLLSEAQVYFLLLERSVFWGKGSLVLDSTDSKKCSNPCFHPYLEGITASCVVVFAENYPSLPHRIPAPFQPGLHPTPHPHPPVVGSHSLVSF